WFRQLDQVIAGTSASYYDSESHACHLDLIPFATECKWTDLTRTQRERLVDIAGDVLAHLLFDSPVQILVLNGRSVVEQLQLLAGVDFERSEMPGWSLRRNGKLSIAGVS